VSERVELHAEPAGGDASRALFAEYVGLVRERVGDGFEPTERIFATQDAFGEAGAAWLVAYEDGRPVGCGGLRPLAPGVGEIKRMFVTARARGRGHGRALLRELERLAAASGQRRLRLLTNEVLGEALALYESEGYDVVERVAGPGATAELWLEKALA
jgi:GNAT superfamily N-acetyltransferase